MQTLQALIFDVDGTLADTERFGHLPAFNRAFAEAGLDWRWSEQEYGELLKITGGRERIRYYLDHHVANPPALSDEQIAGLHRHKTKLYTDFVATGQIPLRPGVARLLNEARAAGLRLAIATTTSLDNVTTLLEHTLGGAGWFEVIGAGDMAKAKKPAPDIYRYVLDALRLSPAECVALEDSRNGLRAAQGAGLPVLITVCDYTRGEDFSGAPLVLDHLGEPDQPFTVLNGNAGPARYVDVALLRSLLIG
jgi:HAD superfamily hydrolase (TIGR01509 family)